MKGFLAPVHVLIPIKNDSVIWIYCDVDFENTSFTGSHRYTIKMEEFK